MVKTRVDAAALVSAGRVRLNGERVKDPAHAVKLGHVLTVTLDSVVRILKVEGFAPRRGDADQARTLYSEPDRPSSAS